MASAEQTFMRWAFKPKTQRESILKKAVREYGSIIYQIADDIFDSCIAHYYASYTPTVYTRHGDKKGFNLYRLNDISFDGSRFVIGFDSDFLLKYGTKNDIREAVMDAVFEGKRGHEGMNRSPRPTDDKPEIDSWPMDWLTSYPNKFSQYNYWSSKHNTIDEIFYDFVQNVIDDTEDLFWSTLNKYV